ncbi:hypothetical protein CAI21_15060 [Alkalilimnicola ehrlichii]|uniref:Glycosyltransferase 2-like domain-containing protein n=1 Tax=Alkalilimnicola ehrlichii TaxID=351052 RepID=A0A3E0WQV3_9GAMM|nr:glycosyltransferase family 2 protein [Alkalilimnicola ehrlichii]RFA27168.1 hypothetical protein CAI21_15060 [Alkalilimnicola ehrlichii]RFA35342.1 hypothetical protein CAL65_12720 [Alkalilimnicola ehrlichii]
MARRDNHPRVGVVPTRVLNAAVSVVIPIYNEVGSLERVVGGVAAALPELAVEHEIVLVDDGSSDGSGAIVDRLVAESSVVKAFKHDKRQGYGAALRTGFAAASKDWVVLFPADGQFDISELRGLLQRGSSADLVVGYRRLRRDGIVRALNAWLWNRAVRLRVGYLCQDIDCGFKLFRREIFDQVRLSCDSAAIDTELLMQARSQGYVIDEIEVTHRPRLAGRASGAEIGVILRAVRDLLGLRRPLSAG